MNFDVIKLLLDIVQYVITGAVGVYVWWSKRQQVTRERIDKLETRQNERIDTLETHLNQRFNTQGERITVVETQVKNLPTAAVISDLSAEVAELRGATTQLNQNLRLIQEHLLDRRR